MNHTLIESLKERRTVYDLGRNSGIKSEEIIALVKDIIDVVPSAYNSQSQRAVVLTGAAHDKLWSIVLESLRKVVPAAAFGKTEAKIKGFAAAEGTILFFDDQAVTDGLIKKYPLYADHFKAWAEQQNGMLQLAVWAALSDKGLGANLQHYNPLIDDEVKSTWGLNKKWKLRAQMVYGKKLAEPDPRDHQDINTRVFSFTK